MPTVFFTDANGPCYHTVDDEIGVVDFDKLDEQIAISLAVTRELASTSNPPAFVPGTPLATFDDAVGCRGGSTARRSTGAGSRRPTSRP